MLAKKIYHQISYNHYLRGDLHFFDLFEENNQNTKWRFFTSLNSEKGHKKTIYDISCSGNYLISLSLDRLVISHSFSILILDYFSVIFFIFLKD